MSPNTGRIKSLGYAGLAINVAIVGLDLGVSIMDMMDESDINNQLNAVTMVAKDTDEALTKRLIGEQYRNKESISNIMQVMLTGENRTKDEGIYSTAMSILSNVSDKSKLAKSPVPLSVRLLRNVT